LFKTSGKHTIPHPLKGEIEALANLKSLSGGFEQDSFETISLKTCLKMSNFFKRLEIGAIN
jgi:hypothetical protein